MTSQIKTFKKIKASLDRQFEKQFPPSDNPIMSDKLLILEMFKEWYNFWDYRDPVLTDLNMSLQNNELLLMKKQICGNKKIAILKELEQIGLVKEFLECKMRLGIV